MADIAPVPERKTVGITGKRQFVIPQESFGKHAFGKEAECMHGSREPILRPIRGQDEVDFSEQIAADLIAQGYGGDELLRALNEEKARIRPAVEAILKEAGSAAKNPDRFATYNDVFGFGGEE